MESQLQSLIDRIRTDGVAEAEKQAKAIIEDAERNAQRILSEAKSQADAVVEGAKRDAARAEEAGKKALEQAGRNLILGLEKSIRELLDRILREEIETALTPDVLGAMLEKIIARWEPEKGVVVGLSERDERALARGLFKKLEEKAKTGVTLQPVETVDAGFSISEKGGELYYDFTSAGIAEFLSQYLNPTLAEILKKGFR